MRYSKIKIYYVYIHTLDEHLFSKVQNIFQHLGDSLDIITQLKSGTHPFSSTLKNAKKPLIILGAEQLTRKDGAKILAETQALAKALESTSKVITL